MPLVLGVTGGIATGKSTVMKMLAELGAQTVSADEVAREVLARGTPAYHETVGRFGPGIVAETGEIDRAALGRIIFSDPAAREALNDITHPRIIAEMQRRIDAFRADPPASNAVLAAEIPLLIECGLEGMVDQVLLVAAEQETQASRLTSRSRVSSQEAVRMIASQMPMERKKGLADRVIANDGTLDLLRDSVKRLWEELLLL